MTPRRCVSIIIVAYESCRHIEPCLKSIYASAEPWICDCIVVDNASSDDTVSVVRKNFPLVHLVANAKNVGFGQAVNIGVSQASGEYLLILNPDTVLEDGAIGELISFLDSRKKAAACGPKIMDQDGRFRYESRRGFPTPANSLGKIIGLDRIFPRSRMFGSYQMRALSPDIEMMTDVLSGACTLVRRESFLSVGGFDEDYFLFGEDIDLCWKLKQAGHEIWYIPTACIRHVKGASMHFARRTAKREFYRSMKLFIDKRLRAHYSFPLIQVMKFGVDVTEIFSLRSWRSNKL